MEWDLEDLVRHAEETQVLSNNKWVPVRPKRQTGYQGFKLRLKSAWHVLTGKSDAVVWPRNQ